MTVYWVAVKSGNRLGGGIEGIEEDAVKEWKGGKGLSGLGVTLSGNWRGLGEGSAGRQRVGCGKELK